MQTCQMSRRQKTSSPASVPVSIQIHTKHGGCRLRSTGFGSDLDIKCKRERERKKEYTHTHTHKERSVLNSCPELSCCLWLQGLTIGEELSNRFSTMDRYQRLSMSESLVFQVYTGYLQQTHYIYISIKKI